MPSFAFNYISKNAQLDDDIDLSSLIHVISCSEPTFHHDIVKFQERFRENKLNPDCVSVCYALAENVFAVSQSGQGPKPIKKVYPPGTKVGPGYTEPLHSPAAQPGVRLAELGGVSYVSCGRVIPGVSIIIEKDGEDVTNDSEGRVMMRSFYEPHTNVRSDFHGYYDTGDVGFMRDQELYIIGRTKDSFVSYGVNVYPETIEHEISKMEGVIDGRVACFGVFSGQSGTHECHVCVETERSILENAISLRIREVFGLSAIVEIVPPGSLSKTSSGKISRSKTRERLCSKTS